MNLPELDDFRPKIFWGQSTAGRKGYESPSHNMECFPWPINAANALHPLHSQDLALNLLLRRLQTIKEETWTNQQMTLSTIFKLHLDTYLKVNCFHMATHKLYAHDALIRDKNAHDLFTPLKTDVLGNVHPSTSVMLPISSFGKWWVYSSVINCFVSIWSNVISLV